MCIFWVRCGFPGKGDSLQASLEAITTFPPWGLTADRGIPLSPFLHGSFSHAGSNTVPLLVLGGLVGIRGSQALVGVSLFVIMVGGVAVWGLGRTAIHVGASGLVFGYFGLLISKGLVRPQA